MAIDCKHFAVEAVEIVPHPPLTPAH